MRPTQLAHRTDFERATRALMLRLTPAEYDQVALWAGEAGIAQLSRFVKHHLFVGNPPITPNGLNRRPIFRLTLAMAAVHQDCLALLSRLDRREAHDPAGELTAVREMLTRTLGAMESALEQLAAGSDVAAHIYHHTSALPRMAAVLEALATQHGLSLPPKQRSGL